MTTKWVVPKEWIGETAVIFASGPTMSHDVANYVRGKARTIAISNQGIDTVQPDGRIVPATAPWADVMFSADSKWWETYHKRACAFAGIKVTTPTRVELPPSVFTLDPTGRKPFDPRPTHLATGGNSGYQGLHLAVHFGATRILLCGFDMKDVNNRSHNFGVHEGRCNRKMRYEKWIVAFRRLAPVLRGMGIEVINCSQLSALDCFPKRKMSEVL